MWTKISKDEITKARINVRLKYMYQVTTFLSVMMVVWILWMPGSWLMGRSQVHDKVIGAFLDSHMKHGIVPHEVVSKYQGHSLIHFTHLLPAAVWSAIIPFQLHREFRKNHPILHRSMGYAFFGSSLLVAVGVFVILHRDLYFERFFDDLPPLSFTSEPIMYLNTFGFLGCALNSLTLARNKQFFDHQLWIVRHISFGLWVAVQRFLLGTVAASLFPPPVPREVQRMAFVVCGFAGMITCHGCSEYSIYLLKQERELTTKTA
ncbi:DUF2306 domain containing membrane protein [Nitzschia inconspicua]|uniref:DUF2306 domain containing membrane protein n=1 Tax=Nitzschia inconspicua TaxID=303405 RepID=A0A9K3M1K4_9STRA|nr:DUF2306 domain containing membrane protein [Nitzschia inconspicua]KAG7372409.1 DUF2306 domain containing membrane protein [Nitzschia inconspicua]